jgi:hypothetical protein
MGFRSLVMGVVLFASGMVAGSAGAELEELVSETAHVEVEKSAGVVLVDLFADW